MAIRLPPNLILCLHVGEIAIMMMNVMVVFYVSNVVATHLSQVVQAMDKKTRTTVTTQILAHQVKVL